MSAENPTEIIFSEAQQQSLLGHAVTDKQVFEAAESLGVTGDWYFNPNQKSVWDALAAFHTQHLRHPTMSELVSMPAFVNEEKRIVDARLHALRLSVEGKDRVGMDSLLPILREWAKGQRFVEAMVEADRLYTNKDLAKAYAIIMNLGQDLDRLDKGGLVIRCQASSQRVMEERIERVEQHGKLLSYGVAFLDEATGGMAQNELVVIGAKTGVGKTQLVTQIASTNAKAGKRVALFALEAEKYEIERRIKFGIVSRLFRKAVARGEMPPMHIDYRSWRQGKYEVEFDRFDAEANAEIARDYATLETIYRSGGDYSMKELERDIMRLAPHTDLIIVDHLHYIDITGENENFEVTQIMKGLRDMALVLGKPIVLVAHMRKTMGGRKNAPLCPDVEDFHGSGNIIKIATTAIILAPCYDAEFTNNLDLPDSFWDDPATKASRTPLWPTYIRVAKFRLDGAITRFCAVGFYDAALGSYRKEYALGRLVSNDAHWEPEKSRLYWAEHGVINLQPTNR